MVVDAAWAGVEEPLGGRSAKPRETGVTMVIDKGMPLGAFADWLALVAPYVDVVKLGFGTGLVCGGEVVRRKVALLRSADVLVCPGGTLLEIAWEQGRAAGFIARLADMGFTALEVSDGTVTMPPGERRRLIAEGARRGLRVLTEVGKKDPGQALPPAVLRETAADDLASGAWKVIVEARDSGRGIGIFDGDGALREQVMDDVGWGLDPARLLWEAPQPRQQVALLKRLGPEANLGNVAPADVISLEAGRRGLRSDTWAPVLGRHSRRVMAMISDAADTAPPTPASATPRMR